MNVSYLFLLVSTVSIGCQSSPNTAKKVVVAEPVQHKDLSMYKKAYFAAGCFWCVEAIFESVRGVEEVISGYSGGDEKKPTYEQVGGGETAHAEAVEIYYDPKVVSFETLVKVFFGSHDPTTLNRQGPDRGTQYRSIAFYENDAEKQSIEGYIKKLAMDKVYSAPVVTQVVKFKTFWRAEEYHQNYERLHPDNPYVKSVSVPRLKRFRQKFPEVLKAQVNE